MRHVLSAGSELNDDTYAHEFGCHLLTFSALAHNKAACDDKKCPKGISDTLDDKLLEGVNSLKSYR